MWPSRPAVVAVGFLTIAVPAAVTGEGGERLHLAPLDASIPFPPDPLRLRIAWMDVTGAAAPGAAPIAMAEAKAILATMGLDGAWRRSSAREYAKPGEIRVILVNFVMPGRSPLTPVLGSAAAGLHEMPCFWVFVPSVREALGLPPRRSTRALSLSHLRELFLSSLEKRRPRQRGWTPATGVSPPTRRHPNA